MDNILLDINAINLLKLKDLHSLKEMGEGYFEDETNDS